MRTHMSTHMSTHALIPRQRISLEADTPRRVGWDCLVGDTYRGGFMGCWRSRPAKLEVAALFAVAPHHPSTLYESRNARPGVFRDATWRIRALQTHVPGDAEFGPHFEKCVRDLHSRANPSVSCEEMLSRGGLKCVFGISMSDIFLRIENVSEVGRF